ncbi:MAG TPA: rod shape-determining protein MreD [Gaiellaceae bacterium]|nr:rod shape-determining protein MreD [Gaiellaceae bacterium]
MTPLEALKAATLLLLAALLQVSIVTPLEVASGHPDLVLVLVIAIALVRGPLFGSVAGFWAGLAVDVASFATLGLSSLLLTLAGYWAGRFGEATTRASPYPPLIAVGLGTGWIVLGSGVLHFMLGEGASATQLLGPVLVPTLALNLLLTLPVYRLARRLFPVAPRERREAVALV